MYPSDISTDANAVLDSVQVTTGSQALSAAKACASYVLAAGHTAADLRDLLDALGLHNTLAETAVAEHMAG